MLIIFYKLAIHSLKRHEGVLIGVAWRLFPGLSRRRGLVCGNSGPRSSVFRTRLNLIFRIFHSRFDEGPRRPHGLKRELLPGGNLSASYSLLTSTQLRRPGIQVGYFWFAWPALHLITPGDNTGGFLSYIFLGGLSDLACILLF